MIDVDSRQPFIDKNLAKQLIRRAKSYVLVGEKLYRRGATSGVLPEKKARTSWRRYTKASATTTHLHVRWSARPSDELPTGPQPRAMPKNSSEGAKGANTSPSNNTSRPTS
jgi:hypothetical protein